METEILQLTRILCKLCPASKHLIQRDAFKQNDAESNICSNALTVSEILDFDLIKILKRFLFLLFIYFFLTLQRHYFNRDFWVKWERKF